MCSDFWLVLLAVISSYGRESLKGLSNFFSLSASLSISRQWIIVVYRFVMSSHSNTYPTDILAVVLLSVRAVTSPLLAVNSEWPYKRNFYRNWHNRFISYFFGGEGLWRINCHSLTFKDSYCNTDLVIHWVLVLNVLRNHIAISEEKKSDFFFWKQFNFFHCGSLFEFDFFLWTLPIDGNSGWLRTGTIRVLTEANWDVTVRAATISISVIQTNPPNLDFRKWIWKAGMANWAWTLMVSVIPTWWMDLVVADFICRQGVSPRDLVPPQAPPWWGDLQWVMDIWDKRQDYTQTIISRDPWLQAILIPTCSFKA